ncbi:hypothetical protein GGI00_005112 [Coemansia sp. RSA 2681]|nr:hypothetical protein GGI00_005112 [Coemansia sp. RSA 2681]
MGLQSSGENGTEDAGIRVSVPDFQGSVVQLLGHRDNIPSVDISACGQYLASASIDRTIRVWSCDDQAAVFTWRHHQWCWAVRFVYPFYFIPDTFVLAESNCSAAEVASVNCTRNSDLGYAVTRISTADTDDDDMPTDLVNITAELAAAIEVAAEAAEAEEVEGGHALDEVRAVIDHSADIENGHEHEQTGSSSSNNSGDADSGIGDTGFKGRVTSNALPTMASPLLLCGTERDVLLLDPANVEAPVVSSIVRATSRTAQPTFADLSFDRLTFLEWVPELAIVVAGSLSGTVALISLQQCSGANQATAQTMQVLARLPAEAANKQLYGVAVYRHMLDVDRFKAVTLLLTYIDGAVMAYELLADSLGKANPL